MPNHSDSAKLGAKLVSTSYDVALKAGVSQSAVSRCFKKGASVAPATRAKILKAARELNYMPNAIAQGLINRRSNLVAILISNLTNLYYPEALAELTQRLSERGVRVLLFTLKTESDVKSALAEVWRYRVDGVIAAAKLDNEAIGQLNARGVPLVLYNRQNDSIPVSSVSCDNFAGERLLVDLLAAAGHKRFGLIAGPSDSAVSQARVSGAVERLKELKLDFATVEGAYDYQSGRTGLHQLRKAMNNRLDAVIAANDVMAIGAVDAARFDLELKVPKDLSIVGFDGVAPAAWAGYDLTTICQPVHRMAEAAVAMVMERIESGEALPERRMYSGELRKGGSARLKTPRPALIDAAKS